MADCGVTDITQNNDQTMETEESTEKQEIYQESIEPVEVDPEAEGEKLSKEDEDERKIFVGGISWETSKESLKDYFEKFGEVSECVLKTDLTTGRSRGFGFITFKDKSSVDKVFEVQEHKLDERTIDPKRAQPRKIEGIKKIFVGGLDPDMPEEEVREFFSKFGKVEAIELPVDKTQRKRRAFCFITFESQEVVDEVVKDGKLKVGDKECDVKKAVPMEQKMGRGRGAFFRGGRGNRGGYGSFYGYGYNPNYGGYGYGGYGSGYDNYGYNTSYTGWDYGNQHYGQGYGGYGGR